MIVLLKIYAAGKIFAKICLQAIRDTFFSNMRFVIRGGTGGLNFLVGVISNSPKFKRLGLQGDPSPNSLLAWSESQLKKKKIPFLSGTSLSTHKENSDEGAWSDYYDDFEE